MAKKKGPTRPRTARRLLDAQREKLYEARKKLAALDVGGTPGRPMEVASASVVETRAEAEPCLRCGDPLYVEDHTTLQTASGLLRVVKVGCRACGAERTYYVRIIANYLN